MSLVTETLDNYFELHPIHPHTHLAVAVSGGADSLCLALALSEYAKKNKLILSALTVNHGLRVEAEAEAQKVKDQLKKRNIPHTTLYWRGKKPKTHLEEQARLKRYELMFNWCHKHHINYLFLAHHIGDQAETFWSRLSHKSGLDGLTAMTLKTQRDGIFLCRPFLSITKKDCENDLKRRNLSWAQDPMNNDETYERVRWRHRQPTLSQMGLNEASVYKVSQRLNRAKIALDFYTNRFIDSLVDWHPEGFAFIQENAFRKLPEEIQIRVILSIIKTVTRINKPIPLETVEKWQMSFPKKETLAGCILLRNKGLLYVTREVKHIAKSKTIIPNKITLWDRFLIKSPYPIHIQVGSKDKTFPTFIRQSIPSTAEALPLKFTLGPKKELEKAFQVDYKDVIQIGFIKDEK